MPFGDVDDESVAEALKLVGKELPMHVPWVRYVNEDSITHFTDAIADYNPLFNDTEYASKSPVGTLLAPPTFVFAVLIPGNHAGMPGVSLLYGGTDFTFYDWVKSGDEMAVTTSLTDMVEKSGRFADRMILQTTNTKYFRTNGGERELVAVADSPCLRLPSKGSKARGNKDKYSNRPEQTYTPQQTYEIEEAQLAEIVRGSTSRYWEDVEVGEELPPVVRGPLTTTDIMAVYAGFLGARVYGGTGAAAIRFRRNSGEYFVNPKTGGLDSLGRGHLEVESSNGLGMGGAYDIGPGRCSWAGTIVTNWIGDDGFLHKLNVRCWTSNLVGDTTYITAQVTGKSTLGDRKLVDIKVTLRNQLDEVTMDGTAQVVLPSRETGPVRLPIEP